MAEFQPQDIKSRITPTLSENYFSLMQEYGDVRMEEFIQLKHFAKLKAPKNILDVPTEGILMRNLFPNAAIDFVDWIVPEVIAKKYGHKETNFEFKNLQADCYDAVLGIVPIHHASSIEKSQYLFHSHRVLKSKGTLAFAEVEIDSGTHYFLDEFVNNHSLTGHKGAYVDASFNAEISKSGFGEVESEFKFCPWIFESKSQLVYFFTKFFGLHLIEDDFLIDKIKHYLSIEERNDKLIVGWGLRYFKGLKI
jgi:hypothetical protein